MNKSPDIVDGEDVVRKHIRLTEPLFDSLQAEAWEKTGGNFSWLLRIILRERYTKKAKA